MGLSSHLGRPLQGSASRVTEERTVGPFNVVQPTGNVAAVRSGTAVKLMVSRQWALCTVRYIELPVSDKQVRAFPVALGLALSQ